MKVDCLLCRVVTQESNRLEIAPRPPVALTNAVSWRPEGVKHRKNEIFLDVIEKVNILVASNGTVLHCDILGSILMKSFLSGMPELKLGLNDKLMFEMTGRANTRIKVNLKLNPIWTISDDYYSQWNLRIFGSTNAYVLLALRTIELYPSFLPMETSN